MEKDKVIADWIMVEYGDIWQGVKEWKKGQNVMSVHELQKEIEGLIEADLIHPNAHYHLFNDNLVVQQGVFRWDSKFKSFRKIADNYHEISSPVKMNPR